MVRAIDISIKGLPQEIRRQKKLYGIVSQPETYEMVRGMAAQWERNFASEGGEVGGWRDLAPMTQEVRQKRGFDPKHPILVQTGELRNAAVRTLLSARGPVSYSGAGVKMMYVGKKLVSELIISGPKVDTQFRVRGAQRAWSQPPRPFWYVNKDVEKAAADGLTRWLQQKLGGI